MLSAGTWFPIALQLDAISAAVSGQVIKRMPFRVLAGGSDLAKAILSLYNELLNSQGEGTHVPQQPLRVLSINKVALSLGLAFHVFPLL